ncbi:MAG: DUF3800 domain-containing protein [Elusimicrobia bacterium]|nr:DUF3800 domain-containing protein [Elusimicrobiota bacterium]
MKRFRLYVDESGDHTYHDLGNPAKRYLGLTGVAIEMEYYRTRFHPDVESLKQKHFPHNPDEPIIFHRKELINRNGAFGALADPKRNEAFASDMIAFLAGQEYRIFTVVIDKKAHSERYGKAALHPYHHCLTVLLERYREFLGEDGSHGDVMAESRGGAEDMELKRVHREVVESGLYHVSAAAFKEVFTSRELKLKKKAENIAGLQVADLLAYPLKQDILVKGGVSGVTCGAFGERICAAVRVKQGGNGRTLL